MEHSFNTKLAEILGIEKAVLVRHFFFWIAKNAANRVHFHDGRYWTYNSASALAELFPYLSADSIKRHIKKLVDDGFLLKGNYNKVKMDRTNWYALSDYAESIMQKCEMDCAILHNGKCENARPIPDIITDIESDNSYREKELFSNENKEKEKAEAELCPKNTVTEKPAHDEGGAKENLSMPRTKEKESSAKERESLSFVREDMLDMFKEFLAYRREICHPLRPVSYERAYKQLLELSNGDSLLARKIIDQSIANGWRGLFKLKTNDTTRTNERTATNHRLFVTPRDPNEPERDDLPF